MQIRKLLCCAFIAVAVSRKVSAAPLAGPFANPSNGHSYYLLNPDTWTGFEAQAVGLGGHLATVRSQSENDWILNTFGPLVGNSGPNIWIGFYDPTTGDGNRAKLRCGLLVGKRRAHDLHSLGTRGTQQQPGVRRRVLRNT